MYVKSLDNGILILFIGPLNRVYRPAIELFDCQLDLEIWKVKRVSFPKSTSSSI